MWTTGRAQARAFCSAPHLSLRLVLVPPAAPLSLSSRLVSATATATASRGIGASERARARGLVFSLDPFRFVVVDDEPSPRRDGDFVSAGQVRARSKRHAPCMAMAWSRSKVNNHRRRSRLAAGFLLRAVHKREEGACATLPMAAAPKHSQRCLSLTPFWDLSSCRRLV